MTAAAPRQRSALENWLRLWRWRIWQRLFPKPPPPLHTEAYSQEGEDLILRRIFQGKEVGFYADVGAHHPQRFSNTYLFYRLGWSGSTSTPCPAAWMPSAASAPAIATSKPPSGARAARRGRSGSSTNPRSTPSMKRWPGAAKAARTATRSSARARCQPAPCGKSSTPTSLAGTAIDFLSIDVEGLDLEALQSNDLGPLRPHYVLEECYGVPPAELPADPICRFLAEKRYEIFAKTVNTVIFRDQSRAA